MCPRYLQRSAHWAQGIIKPLGSQLHHFTKGFVIFAAWLTFNCLGTKKEVCENTERFVFPFSMRRTLIRGKEKVATQIEKEVIKRGTVCV